MQKLDNTSNTLYADRVTTRLSLGEYVRHLRRHKGWGLQNLADTTGLSVSHLSRIENDIAVPNAETVVKLATALDGDLEQMLTLADCLPQEILERLVRRAGGTASAHRRSAGEQADEGFVRDFIEDIDPAMRSAIAKEFDVPEDDVDSLWLVLGRIRKMSPAARGAVIRLLAAGIREEEE